MEKSRSEEENIFQENLVPPEQEYKAVEPAEPEPEKTIREFSDFSPEQQEEILYKQKVLSSLAYFIGKDFKIPVELNEPGAGWHWDFENNIIRIDPKDLLEKSMDVLRFIICHEGGHRRISRTEFIPPEEWKQPGFPFMMNAIEDGRDNNFVAESYPKFAEQMELAYNEFAELEAKAKEESKEKLGQQPRFMQAGFEYLKQWFRETQGQDFEISEDLPREVKDVVEKTLKSAQDSWLRYPSREEADKSEEVIVKYAKLSYEINRDEVWPEFKKLVEMDLEDQKTQEFMKDMQGRAEGGQGLPRELKDKLTEEEQQQIKEFIEKAINETKKEQQENQVGEQDAKKSQKTNESDENEAKGKPVNMDDLPENLKQKIKEYIDSLPEDQKQEIAKKAKAALKEFEDALNKELQGKLSENPEEKAEREKHEKTDEKKKELKAPEKPRAVIENEEALKKYHEFIQKSLEKDANVYEKYRREVLPIIKKLEDDLREIFVKRRDQGWISGFKTGKRIDIKKRIQEKAKGVPAIESRAWQKRELPQEKDYAISLLVDLSASMTENNKINETFKAVVALSEALSRLSINLEILGFNDRIYEYRSFDQPMSSDIRNNMGGMLKEVYKTINEDDQFERAAYNDDGWAIGRAAERLNKRKENQKFLIVLSDGEPIESPAHSGAEYDLSKVIREIQKQKTIKLAGLGIGEGTEYVKEYYPHSIAGIKTKEMAEKLADFIEEVIAHYDKF